ncbi:hypothetical protein [Dyella kyungheensis]|uniref:DUF4168 domain-containing protein n=1 Tax=Dyella kyungheensis TaxID=1242174 RepID=A0ABS2JUV2_9GAMM|nr:hypothetical protein [Dyella kyungheensis]MBM7122793.1 hypothetical protein [Dyella kyungheensis]
MKRKYWLPVAAAMMLVLQVASVHAKETKPDVKADTKDEFAAVADHVRQQMAPGGRFDSIPKNDQQTVTRDLSSMESLFDKFGKVDAMDQPSKVELFNNQSEVNAILTRHDGDRQVCEQIKPMGSNIPKTVCKTQRQINLENDQSQRTLQDIQNQSRQSAVGGH